jgi:hypothetical protein
MTRVSGADLPYGPPIVSGPEDEERAKLHEEAIRSLTRVRTGATLLRVVAIVAAIIWAVALVSTAALAWHTVNLRGGSSLGLPIEGPSTPGGWELVSVIQTATLSTWGYGLVAVLALAGSVWIDRAQAHDDLDVLDGDLDDD